MRAIHSQTSVISILVTVLIPVNNSQSIFTSPLSDGCRGIFIQTPDPTQKSQVFSLSESSWGFQASEKQSPAGVGVSSKCVTAPLKKLGRIFSPNPMSILGDAELPVAPVIEAPGPMAD